MPQRLGYRPGYRPAARRAVLAVLLAVAGLGLHACGSDAPPEEKLAAATAGSPEAGGALPGPAPPSPATALNAYADECLTGDLPADEEILARLTTSCMEHLLETLRAAIGTAELPQAEVGPRLDAAEVEVHQLVLVRDPGEYSTQLGAAALAVLELAGSVGEVLPAADGGAPPQNEEPEREARAAAQGIAGGTPLTEQGQAVARLLRTADGVVRPLVRRLQAPPPATAPADV